ncbi:MAG: NDP-hexose 2,3-dehydratase family protein [Kutzneria sp.]|nr:NDP-hexose 2,3-dehydratase family protein [Kutzneria sp.]
MFEGISDFHDWFAERRSRHLYRVSRAPLDQLAGWSVDPDTHTIRHQSGKFFSIDGLEVITNHGPIRTWSQPIIDQNEVGILGILVKKIAGVPHFLMQAKMEPGNINLLQLSPTVQATRSNYTRVHKGKSVPYLDYFRKPGRCRILSDVLQSEQGSWFLHKRNRNMIIETADDVPVLDDFCWLAFDQIADLLLLDNVVNMDSRTVLAGYPFSEPERPGWLAAAKTDTQAISASTALDRTQPRNIVELLSWFTEVKSGYQLSRTRISLRDVKGWICSLDSVTHEMNRYFSVVGVDVEAGSREVGTWSQPMLAPTERGVVAFLVKRVGGGYRVLVQAHTQAGTLDVVEMAPTVQCAPGNYDALDADRRPPFLDYVLSAPREQVLLDVVHSEEGGRFYHAENRYLIITVPDDSDIEAGPDFSWMTVSQLADIAQYGNYVNIEARSLLACLRFLRHAPAVDDSTSQPTGRSRRGRLTGRPQETTVPGPDWDPR